MTPDSSRPRKGRPDPEASGRSVCIIAQNMGFGGMEVHTLALMGALLDLGYAIELVVNRYDRYDAIVRERGWLDRTKIIHTDLGGILYGERSNRHGWRRVLSGLRSRLLIFPKGNHNFGQLGFLQECRRAFAKVVFIEHLEPRARPSGPGARRFGLPATGLWWYKRRFLSKLGSGYADHIVAVSEKVRHRLITDIGYNPDKVSVVRNGVPYQEFARDAGHRASVRQAYDIPADAFVFGMLSRLSVEKGIDTSLLALRQLSDEAPEHRCYLVVAGEGPDAGKLADLTRRLNLESRVRFIGFVDDPHRVVSAYDVILFSSRLEGLPLGLLQGMAAGCVPIVTRISGMPEAVNSPEVGWVVAPDDPAALSQAMKAASVMDAGWFGRMSRAALERVRDHFDIVEANRKIVELCES